MTKITRENSVNLIHQLMDRESGINYRHHRWYSPASPPLMHELNFFRSITPRLTIENVDKPNGFLRKFTPDGKLLLSFSHDQRSLEVYTYKGVGALGVLLQHISHDWIRADSLLPQMLELRQQAFKSFFVHRWSISMINAQTRGETLNREFSIFLENGRYVLLVTTGLAHIPLPFPENCYPNSTEIYGFENYTFYLVDLSLGCVTHHFDYQSDLIALSHNHGVSVHDNTVAIFSKRRQAIDILELESGTLVFKKTVGPFYPEAFPVYSGPMACHGFADERLYVSVDRPRPFSCINQRILSFLYMRALNSSKQREFYKKFLSYENMMLDNMQLITTDIVFLRYDCSFPKRLYTREENDYGCLVFYDFIKDEVLNVYNNESVELLYLLRDNCDIFRNVRSLQTQRRPSSPSNNVYFRAAFNNVIASMTGGYAEAAKRISATPPISSQSFSTSPYLNYNIFEFDERFISALERPKVCRGCQIEIKDRLVNRISYRLCLEMPVPNSDYNFPRKDLVAFIFHPFEPFIISVQKLNMRYVVNFHIYNQSTEVDFHSVESERQLID